MDTLQLLDWGIRGSLLLAAALLIARLLELRSASAAHRSLIAALACIPLLPLCINVAPGWTWTLPVSQMVQVSGTGSPAVSTNITEFDEDAMAMGKPDSPAFSDLADAPPQVPMNLPDTSAEVRSPAASLNERVSDAAADSADYAADLIEQGSTTPAATSNSVTWSPSLPLAWAAVAGLLLVQVAWCFLQLWRFTRSCSPAPSSLSTTIHELTLEHELKAQVTVLQSTSNSMPMVCWLGRWLMILPIEFESWPRSLQQATVLHELGHIARRDAWADLLAQCVTRVFWLSPVAWVAAWNVRRLRERACDEWALRRCGSAKEYALNLVEVVSRCQPAPPRFSTAMADRGDLESRLRWLLSRQHPQSAQRTAGAVAMLTALSLAVAVATAQPTPSDQVEGGTEQAANNSDSTPPVVLTREPSSGSPKISVLGTVRDPAGRPLAGANVVLRMNVGGVGYGAGGLEHARDVLARSVTDARGQFRFTQVPIPPRFTDAINSLTQGNVGAQLLVWGDEYALTWQPIRSFRLAGQDIRLSPAADVSGVVVDEQGNPVDRANIEVMGFQKAKQNLDGFLRGPDDLNLIRSEINLRAIAEGGRFVLPGIPRDYRVSMQCTSPAGHRAFFLIDTGEGTNKEASYRNAVQQKTTVYRTPMRVVAKQQAWVRIRVVDHQGKQVTGGGVTAISENRQYGGSAGVDENGTALLIVNQPGIHEVRYSGDPLDPVLGLAQSIDIQPQAAESIVMKLPASVTLTGRVIDGDTGAPIPGAYVAANRKTEEVTTLGVTGTMAVSDTDGTFKLPVAEGVYDLSIRHDLFGYLVPTPGRRTFESAHEFPTVTVTSDQPPQDAVIRVARGLVVEGVLRDARGAPLAGVTVQGVNEDGAYRKTSASTNLEGHYRLNGLSPWVSTFVTAWSEAGTAEHTIDPVREHPWDKTLRRTVDLQLTAGTTVSGRVVRRGEPVRGVKVKLHRAPPAQPGDRGTRFRIFGETTTDTEGRYRLTGLQKGDRYHLEVEPQANAEVRDWRYQMPYSHTVEVENGATIDLPDAVLKSNGQSLAGVVVAPDGSPVEGITVSAQLASRRSISRPRNGPPPWTDTDKQGRFHLTHLPDEPISLMAYKANPAGGRIRYPSHASPAMNAQDIRIVLDPALQIEVEDLDSDE